MGRREIETTTKRTIQTCDLCDRDLGGSEPHRRAAAAAVRYRRALQEIADGVVANPVTGRLETMPADMARLIARGVLEGSW